MNTFTKKSISTMLAQQMIEAATKKAQEIGFSIAITIVDESGNLKAFSRMDSAPLIAIDASRKKAVTAVGFGFPTGDAWYNFIKDDPILN
ncbi:MAG: heme-binding protein, partial [Bacteroidota bacterium]